MSTTQTGFKRDVNGQWIEKDSLAVLVYSVDWGTEWLQGDHLANTTFTVSTVSGDAAPLAIHSQGVASDIAWVKLQGGTVGNLYTVKCSITTVDGAVDSRRFRVKVVERHT